MFSRRICSISSHICTRMGDEYHTMCVHTSWYRNHLCLLLPYHNQKSLPGELSRPPPVGPMWATHLAISSSPTFLLPLLTINQPNKLRRLLSSCPRPPNQPIRQIDHPAGFFSAAAFFCMFDRMGHDSSLLVEFENEHAAKFFRLLSQTRRVRKPLRKSVNLFPRSDATI